MVENEMGTDFDTNWDIDKYKSEFESEEHWELRKNFLVAHKDKYPEDKLVCLAQVFFNVELLGCKYPDETMSLVSELSEGIADSYREKKQQKIQRTFVKASDAAEAKVKGLASSEVPTTSNIIEPNSMSPVIANSNPNTEIHETDKEKKQVISAALTELINSKEVNALLKDLVILKTSNENFFTHGVCVLQRSLAKRKLTPEYELTKVIEDQNKTIWQCILSIRGFTLATSTAMSKQVSKKAVNEAFLDFLQEICYTVEEKIKFLGAGLTVDKGDNSASAEESKLSEGNIGSKMMKLMGWKGGGLGKSEQGVAEPITVQNRVQRSGLGTNLTKPELMKRLDKKLSNFAKEESNYDLVFSNDFSKDERAKLHTLAQKYNLNSRSYGTGNDRHLVVSKKIKNHHSIVTMLLSCGGENERYKLIPPLRTEYE